MILLLNSNGSFPNRGEGPPCNTGISVFPRLSVTATACDPKERQQWEEAESGTCPVAGFRVQPVTFYDSDAKLEVVGESPVLNHCR